jgi:hypothetical protein
MSYSLQYSRAYPTSPADAFDRVLVHDLRDLFSARTAAIAPIVEVRDQQGEWGTVGQQRTIVLSDGTAMRETLLRVQPPGEFGYRIDVVAGAMKLLVGGADGSWGFAVDGAGCRITWTWQVDPASALAAVAAPVFRLMWIRNAAKAFDRIGAALAG